MLDNTATVAEALAALETVQPVMELNPDNIDLSGNVTDKFVQQITTPF